MPTIPVNLGDVTSDDLPEGTYLAQVDVHKYNEETGDKKASVRMGYEVIEEGDNLGRKASQWLYFSEKAIFRTKKHYAKFGLEDLENFEVADDSDDIIEPDLVGVQVIIESYLETDRRDPNGPKRARIRLVSVEDDMTEVLEPPKSTAKATKAPAPDVADESEAVADEDDEEEEAPAPRRAAAPARRVAPTATAGKRRTLR
jgi:hypothetical protein